MKNFRVEVSGIDQERVGSWSVIDTNRPIVEGEVYQGFVEIDGHDVPAYLTFNLKERVIGTDVYLDGEWWRGGNEIDWNEINRETATDIAKKLLFDLESVDWEFSWVMDGEGNTNIAVTGFYRNDKGIWEEYIVCEAPNDGDNNFGRFEDMELISNAPKLILELLQRIEQLEGDHEN